MTKATKEAKVHTSWFDPVALYDDAVEAFVRNTLGDGEFVNLLQGFLQEHSIVERGYRNSLAQTALLLTCPGVPDIYQGSEIWDFSLVDPDNRRPVDYDVRRELLAMIQGRPGEPLHTGWDVGAPKLRLINRLLGHRRSDPTVYESDTYEPLAVDGARGDEVVAFSRDRLAVVAPCRSVDDWHRTAVRLPPGEWTHVMTHEAFGGGRQALDAVLGRFPVAVLARDTR
jgi:(1->4)-alpha-D-glucan 1-alpha-D-glucosylmutase